MYSEKGSFNIFPAAFSPFELRRIYSKGEASFFSPLAKRRMIWGRQVFNDYQCIDFLSIIPFAFQFDKWPLLKPKTSSTAVCDDIPRLRSMEGYTPKKPLGSISKGG